MLGTAQVTSTVTMCLIVQYKGSRYFGTSWRTLISVWLLPLLGTAAFSKLGEYNPIVVVVGIKCVTSSMTPHELCVLMKEIKLGFQILPIY